MIPKGIRLNNPTNLTYWPQIRWKGLNDPPNDGRFCWFKSPQFGFRAAYLQLEADLRAGKRTLADIINRWAPPNENDTEQYVHDVCGWSGLEASHAVSLPADGLSLLRAMARKEVGATFPDPVIQEGIDMVSGNTQSITVHPAALVGAAAGLGGYCADLLCGALLDIWHINVPPSREMALAVVLTAAIHYFFPKGDQQ